MEEIEHRDEVFTQFMDNWEQTICPGDGLIHCDHGKVYCSVHRAHEILTCIQFFG